MGTKTQAISRNHKEELKSAFSQALLEACKNTDLKALDWFSYNPDFHSAKQRNAA
jgi:hypothetical protein